MLLRGVPDSNTRKWTVCGTFGIPFIRSGHSITPKLTFIGPPSDEILVYGRFCWTHVERWCLDHSLALLRYGTYIGNLASATTEAVVGGMATG